jgi:hypothetical protein
MKNISLQNPVAMAKQLAKRDVILSAWIRIQKTPIAIQLERA